MGISFLEHDKVDPRLSVLVRLADALGCPSIIWQDERNHGRQACRRGYLLMRKETTMIPAGSGAQQQA